jgi:ADP-ribosylglycohydrolase
MKNFERSAILGLVVGDALGVPVEFKSREAISKKPVVDMIGFGQSMD